MDNCVFCKMVQGQIPSTKVYEDEDFIVVLDLNQTIRGHLLIIPKAHYETVFDMPEALLEKAILLSRKMARAVMKAQGASGVNILNNNYPSAGQSVPHFHIHVLPRQAGDPKLYALSESTIPAGEMAGIAKAVKEALS